jgi:hypothetical protein
VDQRTAAEACAVTCGSCGQYTCAENVDQSPGPGGLSCATIESKGWCLNNSEIVDHSGRLDGVPLWTLCCKSCRTPGCDGVPRVTGLDAFPATDGCGVCNGDESTCSGCDGIIKSGRTPDACGVCDGKATGCCTADDPTCHVWPTTALPTCDPSADSGSVLAMQTWQASAHEAATFDLCLDPSERVTATQVAVAAGRTLALTCSSDSCATVGASFSVAGELHIDRLAIDGSIAGGGSVVISRGNITGSVTVTGELELTASWVSEHVFVLGGARATLVQATLGSLYLKDLGTSVTMSEIAVASWSPSTALSGTLTFLPGPPSARPTGKWLDSRVVTNDTWLQLEAVPPTLGQAYASRTLTANTQAMGSLRCLGPCATHSTPSMYMYSDIARTLWGALQYSKLRC